MRVEIERPRPLHPVGLGTFTLVDVSTVQMPDFNDPSKQVDRWLWKFESDKKTPEGEPYEMAVFTGTRYGNSQSKLTWLLDLLVPGITVRQAEALDTDDLLGRKWEGSVKHETSVKDPEKRFASFSYLKPLIEEGAHTDPFFFDDDAGSVKVCVSCGNEVEETVAKHALKRWNEVVCHPCGRKRIAKEKVDAQNLEPVAV
jgi:DNA-directed RNA polymerase subunit RPC12/RpoP